MEQPDLEAEPYFSQPVRQIVLMLIALGLVSAGVFLALPSVLPVFLSNLWLNGFIFLVFLIGVFSCFAQVAQLIYSVRWIERFAGDGRAQALRSRAPQLLAPLAALLRSRGARMQIGASSTRSILDSLSTRIDEAREITRYIVNTLIFLGLLGTFYGLATTVPALVDTIRSLAPQGDEGGVQVFTRLMTGLEAQLGGMGVAFASSLLGLAGSLVVGLLELFAGHGQNRFYRELEEWLSSFTRVSFATGDGETGSDQSAVAGLMDHMAGQMEALQAILGRSETGRAGLEQKLDGLVTTIGALSMRLEQGDPALNKMADTQSELLEKLDGGLSGGGDMDAESRMRLRSIDVQMLRISEEISAGRQEAIADLRSDLQSLTRAIRQLRPATRAAGAPPASAPTKGAGGQGR
jgi:hypothetical protein